MRPAFPKILSSQAAFDTASAILDGFDKHYRLFRQASKAARRHFENSDWALAQQEARERIDYYDQRVRECVAALEGEHAGQELSGSVWREVKLHYIGLLTGHKQPELAESFFNSVCCRLLHRNYYNDDFLFVRPAVSTEYIENEEPEPVYRVYYPLRDGMAYTIRRIVTNFQLACPFADLERDVRRVQDRISQRFAGIAAEANQQIQVLASLFCRNKGAYIVGKLINGGSETPLVVPILHDGSGRLYLDTALLDPAPVAILFSFTRAYFLVDMEVPSATVRFLQGMLPGKPRSELYTLLGLHKQGKTLFYRDFLHHLRYSSDCIESAPGIRGLVMVVFWLPSFPYVFKAIKDHIAPPKDTTPSRVRQKYLLVKHHDRVGRMADTLEYSDVAFPRARFSEDLLAEIRAAAPSLLEEEGDHVIVRHLYIERRMIPLNIWLAEAEKRGDDAALEHGVREYGNAIKDLVAANIFPGDMLYKNFGVTRHGRVVFYDYDEIEYLADCNFRALPEARNEEEELSAEPWYPVGRNDVFPEQFGTFLLGNPKIRACFMKYHADLLTPGFWQARKESIQAGMVEDIFPYPQEIRFCHQAGVSPSAARAA
ncbi:MAG: bifunctional isocitrate dehydrogenase kinase/phosphatase [Noviherbaspirillum sp.]